ncbi:MAG: insulinase family protein [Rhodospirillaceae bacterium]|jgi:zinc protease|nr:insulinase family protein [Rhodospirillaceae bacterium]
MSSAHRIAHPLRVTLMFALVILTALAARQAAAIDIQRVVSPGGVEAWLVRDTSVPVISFTFAFDGGASLDPVGKEGRAKMVSALLDEGAGDLTSQEFQARLEDIAARLRFSASSDRFSGTLRTLSANRDKAFELLALALTKPRFDAKPVERIRAQMIAGLKSALQDPDTIASRAWYKAVFPAHPYGRPNGGTIQSVKAITIADLRGFTTGNLSRKSLKVGVAGDITAAELSRRLDQIFGALPANGAMRAVPDITPGAIGQQIVIDQNVPQSVVMFGHTGIARDDPDWYTASVMMRILGGGGFASRLTEEVREKRGLAYSVYSYLNPYKHTALIMGGVATANARVAESLKVIRAQWQLMAEKGVTEKELSSAKTYINGSFPLRLDSTRRIAGMVLAIQINKLGIGYLDRRSDLISAVTIDGIKRVAKRLLRENDLTVVVVGRPKGLKSTP